VISKRGGQSLIISKTQARIKTKSDYRLASTWEYMQLKKDVTLDADTNQRPQD